MSRNGKGPSPPKIEVDLTIDGVGLVKTSKFAGLCLVHPNTVTEWHRNGYAKADYVMPRTGHLYWNPKRAEGLAAKPKPVA